MAVNGNTLNVLCVHIPPVPGMKHLLSSNEDVNKVYLLCCKFNCSICNLLNCMSKEIKFFNLFITRNHLPSITPIMHFTTSQPAVKAASLVRDCLPEPPTPTSSAWPRSMRIMRCTRVRCSRASSNSTRFIRDLFSLYSSRISCSTKTQGYTVTFSIFKYKIY